MEKCGSNERPSPLTNRYLPATVPDHEFFRSSNKKAHLLNDSRNDDLAECDLKINPHSGIDE